MGKFVALALLIATVMLIGNVGISGDGSNSIKTGITGVLSNTNAELSNLVD